MIDILGPDHCLARCNRNTVGTLKGSSGAKKRGLAKTMGKPEARVCDASVQQYISHDINTAVQTSDPFLSWTSSFLVMASPTQVDAILLERLTHLGPEAGQDIYVHNAIVNSSSTCEGTCTSESASSSSIKTKLAFQPQQRYYLEGRVIHKRKLSRKLFFLDVSLVRRKQTSIQVDDAHSNVAGSTQTPASDGLELSAWEDVEPGHRSTDDSAQSTHANIVTPYYRLEVIARYPVHTLNGLDDLWRRVQLGSVVKVYGDIELSERSQDDNEEQGHSHRSVLLHCLAFDVLELWQGKEGFEANPGSSEFKSQNTGSRMQRRKRKSGEMSTISSSNGSESKSSLGQEQQTRGDDSQPHCKFWLNSGKCNKEQCLFWHETDLVKLKAERRRWVEEVIHLKLVVLSVVGFVGVSHGSCPNL